MKRFRFEQESLLRVRRQSHRQAEMKLASAQERLVKAKEHLHGLQADLDQLSEAMNARKLSPEKTWRILDVSRQRQEQAQRVTELMTTLVRARASALQDLNTCQIAVDAIETLRAIEWDKYRQRVSRDEQRTLDEYVVNQWARPRTST